MSSLRFLKSDILDTWGSRLLVLWEEAKGSRLVHLGKSQLWGHLITAFLKLWGSNWGTQNHRAERARPFTVMRGERVRHSGHKTKQEKCRLDIGKAFPSWGTPSSGTGCPGRLCTPPWELFKLWLGKPWANCSDFGTDSALSKLV